MSRIHPGPGISAAALTDLLFPEDPVFSWRQVLSGQLVLNTFHRAYRCERGQPPYHPALMIAGFYFYGAMRRICSSRRLVDACHRDVGCMVLTGRDTPDHRTIGEFRQRFTKEIAGLSAAACRPSVQAEWAMLRTVY